MKFNVGDHVVVVLLDAYYRGTVQKCLEDGSNYYVTVVDSCGTTWSRLPADLMLGLLPRATTCWFRSTSVFHPREYHSRLLGENAFEDHEMGLAELELSVRATNCLESEGITTVRDLLIRTDEELLEMRNFGEMMLREVKQKLQDRGLRLATQRSDVSYFNHLLVDNFYSYD